MLTKNDLQQIREVVKTEVRAEVRGIVREEVRVIVKDEVSQQLKSVNRKLNSIQKDMKLMAEDYTHAIVPVRKRVERIEDHLNIS